MGAIVVQLALVLSMFIRLVLGYLGPGLVMFLLSSGQDQFDM